MISLFIKSTFFHSCTHVIYTHRLMFRLWNYSVLYSRSLSHSDISWQLLLRYNLFWVWWLLWWHWSSLPTRLFINNHYTYKCKSRFMFMSVVGLSVEIFMKQSSICVMARITKIAWFDIVEFALPLVVWFIGIFILLNSAVLMTKVYLVKCTQHKHQLWDSYKIE